LINTINFSKDFVISELQENTRKLYNIGLNFKWTFSLHKTSCFRIKDKYLHGGIVSKIDTMQKILIFPLPSYNPSKRKKKKSAFLFSAEFFLFFAFIFAQQK